jgi:hypothetical protein
MIYQSICLTIYQSINTVGGGVHHPDISNEDYGKEDINDGNRGGRVADDDEEMKGISIYLY